jgi:hypothetical protein
MLTTWMTLAPVFEFSDGKGTAKVWLPQPHVVVSQVTGHLSEKIMSRILSYMTRGASVKGYELVCFHDWTQMTSYASESRVLAAAWATSYYTRIGLIHMATKSVLIRMGIAVVNIACKGKIILHNDLLALCKASEEMTYPRAS